MSSTEAKGSSFGSCRSTCVQYKERHPHQCEYPPVWVQNLHFYEDTDTGNYSWIDTVLGAYKLIPTKGDVGVANYAFLVHDATEYS